MGCGATKICAPVTEVGPTWCDSGDGFPFFFIFYEKIYICICYRRKPTVSVSSLPTHSHRYKTLSSLSQTSVSGKRHGPLGFIKPSSIVLFHISLTFSLSLPTRRRRRRKSLRWQCKHNIPQITSGERAINRYSSRWIDRSWGGCLFFFFFWILIGYPFSSRFCCFTEQVMEFLKMPVRISFEVTEITVRFWYV